MRKRELRWAMAALLAIIMYGTVGVALLTAQRQQMAAPLVTTAESAVSLLDGGDEPATVASGSIVAMSKSLSPFTTIYSKDGQPLAGSGRLLGNLPNVPEGMLAASKDKQYSLVTWQPQGALRYEAATVSARNYYVVTAQSLGFEAHSAAMTELIVGFGCVASLVVLTVMYMVGRPKSHTKR